MRKGLSLCKKKMRSVELFFKKDGLLRCRVINKAEVSGVECVSLTGCPLFE